MFYQETERLFPPQKRGTQPGNQRWLGNPPQLVRGIFQPAIPLWGHPAGVAAMPWPLPGAMAHFAVDEWMTSIGKLTPNHFGT